MWVVIGAPAVVIDTQMHIALQRSDSLQLLLSGFVVMGLSDVAMRAVKIALVKLEIQHTKEQSYPRRCLERSGSSGRTKNAEPLVSSRHPRTPQRVSCSARNDGCSRSTPPRRTQVWRLSTSRSAARRRCCGSSGITQSMSSTRWAIRTEPTLASALTTRSTRSTRSGVAPRFSWLSSASRSLPGTSPRSSRLALASTSTSCGDTAHPSLPCCSAWRSSTRRYR